MTIKKAHFLSRETLQAIFKNISNTRLKLIMALGYVYGLDVNEALNIRLRDLRIYPEQIITIKRKADYKTYFLPDKLIHLLSRYLQENKDIREYLFSSKLTNKPITRQYIFDEIKKFNINFKQLREAVIGYLLTNCYSIASIKNYLNLKHDNLWQHLTGDTSEYLNKVKEITGLGNNNVIDCKETLSKDELKKLFYFNIKNKRDKALLYLYYQLGLSPKILTNIRIEDVDINNETIKIHIKGKEKIYPLSETACEFLEAYIETLRDKTGLLFKKIKSGRASTINSPLSYQMFLKLYRKYAEKLGIPHKFSYLRNTLIYQLKDMPVYFIRDYLNIKILPLIIHDYLFNKKTYITKKTIIKLAEII